MIRPLVRLLAATLLTASVAAAQSKQPTGSVEARLIRAQDARDGATLRQMLHDTDPAVRSRAALSLASVQDTAAVAELTRLLADADPRVRSRAALALGQTPTADSLGATALLQQVAVERDSIALGRELEALGRIGGLAALRSVAALRPTTAWGEAQQAMAVARFGMRRIASPDAVATLTRLAGSASGDVRWRAAYAFSRVPDLALVRSQIGTLSRLSLDSREEARMFAVGALGRIKPVESLQLLAERLRLDPAATVRIAAARALASYDERTNSDPARALVAAIRDPNESVSLTALDGLAANAPALKAAGRSQSFDLLDSALTAVATGGPWTDRQVASALVALAALNPDRAAPLIDGRMARTTDPRIRARLIGAWGSDRLPALMQAAADTNSLVATAALDGLVTATKAVAATDPGASAKVRVVLIGALDRGGLAGMTTAATALGDSLFRDPSATAALIRAADRLQVPDDVEPLVEVVKSLTAAVGDSARILAALERQLRSADRTVALAAAGAIKARTGRDVSRQVPARSTVRSQPGDPLEILADLGSAPVATITTTRGTITLRLDPAGAPTTTASFVSLARKGFYDGTTFHRVVPDFVVQGGDPQGDGWGGPGYALRTEISEAGYDRGAVGMASAGKDTEGSQFFITHVPTPHLDGRYTIFAHVTSGLDVVDQLQIGDRILRVTVR